MNALLIGLAALYALAMGVLLVYGLHHLALVVGLARRAGLRDGPVPEAPSAFPEAPVRWPVVTVQLPLYNEPDVAVRLLDAVAAFDYPRDRLEVQVLDDSTDATTALLAARVAHHRARGLDVLHVRRADRVGYKAGALAEAMPHARGEYLALFDADFVPAPYFLRRLVPLLDADPSLGLVQARWAHLNADTSALTRVQAFGLDAHFATEQAGRDGLGVFMSFNGTAGVWRRTCIEGAGGWQADTLAEDLDLSYRAQLAGWRCQYVPLVDAPAELPETLPALRAQQHRWTKGAAEAGRKLLPSLWRADLPLRTKLFGSLHLTAHIAFPFALLAALLHAPLLAARHALPAATYAPGASFFGAMGLGLLGFAGFFLAHVFAQRTLYPDWRSRLNGFPLFLMGNLGLAASNTRALWQAARGERTAFVRTPKAALAQRQAKRSRATALAYAEAALALYCAAGLVVLIALGEWMAVPFQALFAGAFGFIALTAWRPSFATGRR